MGAMQNFLKALGIATETKIVKKTEEIIAANPETSLQKAIEEEETRKQENIKRAAEIKTLLKENEKIVSETQTKLTKIKEMIDQQDKLGNSEEVKRGTELYLKRKDELKNQQLIVEKIKVNYSKVEEIIKQQTKQIEEYKTKKDLILSQLKVAETQQKAIDILSGIKESDNLTKSFESTNKIINKRINEIESISETYDSVNSIKENDPYSGL